MTAVFLEIPQTVADDPGAPYAVLPIPYERTVTFGKGTALGPAAILDASQQLEDFDEERAKLHGLQQATLNVLEDFDEDEK